MLVVCVYNTTMGPFIENNPTIVVGILVALVGIAYWAGSVRTDVNTLKVFMEEIRNDIKKIFERLPSSTTGGQSPINLTDLGKEISQELNAAQWAKSVAISLIHRERQELENSSHYEIQKYCFDLVEERAGLTPMGKEVEKSAYKRGLKKQQVLDVLAVELRDALFEQLKMEKDVDY